MEKCLKNGDQKRENLKADKKNKIDDFFDNAYNKLKNSYELFHGYQMGEDIANIMKPSEMQQMNVIEMEIFQLSKNIKFKLSKANQHQIKVWIIKIKSICDNMEKLCKGLKLGFVYGLFEKIIHCVISLAVFNNFSSGEDGQKHYLEKKNKRRRGQFGNATEIEKIKEDTIKIGNQQHFSYGRQSRDIKKIESKYLKKMRMGGVSLYIQNYRRHAQLIMTNFIDQITNVNGKENKEKNKFFEDMENDLIKQQQLQKINKITEEKLQNLPGNVFTINLQKQQQRNVLRQSSLSYFVKQFAVLQHEINIKNQISENQYKEQWCDLADIYRNQKLTSLNAVKKLFMQQLQLFKLKNAQLMNQIKQKQRIIQNFKNEKSSNIQLMSTTSTQTSFYIDDQYRRSEHKQSKKQICSLSMTIEKLNQLIKNQNIKQMNLDITNAEVKRHNNLLAKKLQEKSKELQKLKARIKKKSQQLSTTKGFYLYQALGLNDGQFTAVNSCINSNCQKNSKNQSISMVLNIDAGKSVQKNVYKIQVARRQDRLQTFYSSVFKGPSFNESFEAQQQQSNLKKFPKSQKALQNKKIKFSRKNQDFFEYERSSYEASLQNFVPKSEQSQYPIKGVLKKRKLQIVRGVSEFYTFAQEFNNQNNLVKKQNISSKGREIKNKQKLNTEIINHSQLKKQQMVKKMMVKIPKPQKVNIKDISDLKKAQIQNKKNNRSVHKQFGRDKYVPQKMMQQDKFRETQRTSPINQYTKHLRHSSLNKLSKSINENDLEQKIANRKRKRISRQNFDYQMLKFPENQRSQRFQSLKTKQRSQVIRKYDKNQVQIIEKQYNDSSQDNVINQTDINHNQQTDQDNHRGLQQKRWKEEKKNKERKSQNTALKCENEKKEKRKQLRRTHKTSLLNTDNFRQKLTTLFPNQKIKLQKQKNRLVSKTSSGLRFYVSENKKNKSMQKQNESPYKKGK